MPKASDKVGADSSETPKRSPRRQRTREARFRRIRETAVELIESTGVDDLTIQALADALDWAPGTLYRYYPSKDALLDAVQVAVIEELHDRLVERLDAFDTWAADAPAEERFLARLVVPPTYYAEFAGAHPAKFRLLALSVGDPKQIITGDDPTVAISTLMRPIGVMAQRIGEAQEQGWLRDGVPQRRAVVLWLTTHIVVAAGKLGRLAPDVFGADLLLRDGVTNALRGWGADPDVVLRAFDLAEQWRTSAAPPA